MKRARTPLSTIWRRAKNKDYGFLEDPRVISYSWVACMVLLILGVLWVSEALVLLGFLIAVVSMVLVSGYRAGLALGGEESRGRREETFYMLSSGHSVWIGESARAFDLLRHFLFGSNGGEFSAFLARAQGLRVSDVRAGICSLKHMEPAFERGWVLSPGETRIVKDIFDALEANEDRLAPDQKALVLMNPWGKVSEDSSSPEVARSSGDEAF